MNEDIRLERIKRKIYDFSV
ncbi:hypothetical protein [Acidianus infernus]